jgi:hypothetical protein
MALKTCFDRFDRTRKECTDLRDEGYETCEEWSKDCVSWARECVVSWIPVIGPAICKVFEWVCRAFEWVCKVPVWISNWVCHAWNFAMTTVCLVFEAVGAVLFVVGIFIKAILSIPLIGALLRIIINTVTGAVIGLVGAIVEGVVCGLGGICLSKRMRVCIIITHNGRQPVTQPAMIQPIIDRTVQIFKDEANVDVEVSLNDGGQVPNVQPGCGADAVWEEFWLTGSQYENAASLHCREYNLASVIGLGSPIYAFCVADVKDKNGCSLFFFTNYVTFEPPGTCTGNTHLAHEIGHACNLLRHDNDDTSNLMYRACQATGRDQLSPFQKAIVRGSKYCTYF